MNTPGREALSVGRSGRRHAPKSYLPRGRRTLVELACRRLPDNRPDNPSGAGPPLFKGDTVFIERLVELPIQKNQPSTP